MRKLALHMLEANFMSIAKNQHANCFMSIANNQYLLTVTYPVAPLLYYPVAVLPCCCMMHFRLPRVPAGEQGPDGPRSSGCSLSSLSAPQARGSDWRGEGGLGQRNRLMGGDWVRETDWWVMNGTCGLNFTWLPGTEWEYKFSWVIFGVDCLNSAIPRTHIELLVLPKGYLQSCIGWHAYL